MSGLEPGASGAAGQPRRLAILALLARAGDRGLTRDKVVSLLWPDADEERARRAITQALYALRQDLGAGQVIVGVKDLRLNPEVVTSDVAEFSGLIEAGDLVRAAALYRGPFLDGFGLPGAAEFERWAETERGVLAHDYAELLERLAMASARSGDQAGSASWWKRLAALDPLSARVTLEMMKALASAGDTAGALQQGRIHQMLVDQELGLPPAREIQALSDELRRVPAPPAPRPAAPSSPTQVATGEIGTPPPAPAASPPLPPAPPPRAARQSDAYRAIAVTSGWATATPASLTPTAPVPTSAASPSSASWKSALGGALVVLLAVAGIFFWRHRTSTTASTGNLRPVVAVGRITGYGAPGSGDIGRPLTDMLATNLARSPGLTVISSARMYELVLERSSTPDTSASGLLAAARTAGATELVDGSLFAMPGGRLRLDLRRVDLTTGSVRQAYTMEGSDLFSLADSGTARLLANLGAAAVSGSLADVSTKSVEAYRLYEEGVRDFYANRLKEAESTLGQALKEDPSFAMAMYYFALAATPNRAVTSRRLNQAVRLADGASDRERLLIKASWAWGNSNPSLMALAETLVVRYPKEIEGPYYLGIARITAGDYAGARGPLHTVLEMDSLGLHGGDPLCMSCRAFSALIDSYMQVDSLPGALKIARLWVEVQPGSGLAWALKSEIFGRMAAFDSAMAAELVSDSLDPKWGGSEVRLLPTLYIRQGRFVEADALLRPLTLGPPGTAQSEAWWQLTISLRNQGRMTEALAAARHLWHDNVSRAGIADIRGAASPLRVPEAQVLYEQGRYATAGALYDSIAAYRFADEDTAADARHIAWNLTHAATSYAAGGDSGRLASLRDSVRDMGALSFQKRDHLLWYYVDGLLQRAQGRTASAAAAIRTSIISPAQGYTRANLELAKLYLTLNRPKDAVAILRSVLHGPLEGSDLYLTLTETHSVLGQAWEASGNPDSAAVHYRWAVNALAGADADQSTRREEMKKKLVALGR